DTVSIDGGMEYGDLLLLCTDGLSDYVSALDIEEILELPKSLKSRLHLLVDKALENGSKDNITVIAVVYYE
ncbi:MAG: serine/threonine-protein phosphatase, partial [Ruminococcus sp.]|nr:serine/threonine-protein phosphatase [Ruminococcus sp.]